MQTLFPKGVLRIEFKSLSPCWQAIGWWPVHRQEDMPRTELSLWERHLLIAQGILLLSVLTCPMSLFSVSASWLHPYVPWARQRWATIIWDPTGFWINDVRFQESLKIWLWLVLVLALVENVFRYKKGRGRGREGVRGEENEGGRRKTEKMPRVLVFLMENVKKIVRIYFNT